MNNIYLQYIIWLTLLLPTSNMFCHLEYLPLSKQLYTSTVQCNCSHTKTFGQHWSICKRLFDYVLTVLPEGSTLLELGSGWASGQFSQYYTVYSVEHDKRWVDQYDTNYIYAPLVNGWYSVEILTELLPKEYGLILVDGPPGTIGRWKFFDNLHLFNTDVPIIFDDVNRKAEYALMLKVANQLGKEMQIFNCGTKKFGVVG